MNEDLELPLIKMATIVEATNNFSRENQIGVGGFGPVYKVIYLSLNESAAVEQNQSFDILTCSIQTCMSRGTCH